MKTKKYSFDEMIDGLQSMSVSELKQVEKNSEVVFRNDGEYPDSDSFKDEYNERMENLTDTIYNLSLSEIKNIHTTPVIIENLSLDQKVQITGLEKWVIIRLETQKENAALKEIITYCEKLKIPFSRFVPEIFSNKMTIK
jgi:hypothetical protein